jgi:hypothetical protein
MEPVFISVSPTMIAINPGTTVQLAVLLTDINGNPVTPSFTPIFTSSNPALLTVDDSGLCTAATLDGLQPGGFATVNVSYPYSNRTDGETMSTVSQIKILANPAQTITPTILQDRRPGEPYASSLGPARAKLIPAE